MPVAFTYGYRNLGPLIRRWEQHYRVRGFTSRRMRDIAYDKARRGKQPPA